MNFKKLSDFLLSLSVSLPEYFSAALSLLNLLENSLGRSKPATRFTQAHQYTVWNLSTISKPYWALQDVSELGYLFHDSPVYI